MGLLQQSTLALGAYPSQPRRSRCQQTACPHIGTSCTKSLKKVLTLFMRTGPLCLYLFKWLLHWSLGFNKESNNLNKALYLSHRTDDTESSDLSRWNVTHFFSLSSDDQCLQKISNGFGTTLQCVLGPSYWISSGAKELFQSFINCADWCGAF